MAYSTEDLYDDTAQIWHGTRDLFGSGRLVATNLILTARHLLAPQEVERPFEESWEVRLIATRPQPGQLAKWTWRKAKVEWLGKGSLDLALLKLLPEEGCSECNPKLQLRIGRIDQVHHSRVRGLGFPRGAKEDEKRTLLVPSGDLGDENEATLGFGVDQSYQPESPKEDWRGFSGGAVVLEDSPDPDVIWIYGVAQQVPAGFTRRLAVARLAKAWEDSGFRSVFSAAGTSLEAPVDPAVPLWRRLTWNGLRERSFPQIARELESVRAKLRISGDVKDQKEPIQSRLLSRWDNFVRTSTWKESCLHDIGVLLERFKEFTGYPEAEDITKTLRGLLDKLQQQQPYSTLRMGFSESLAKLLFASMNTLRNRVLATNLTPEDRRDEQERLTGAQRDIVELMRFGKENVFRKCFLVMGGVGSGKTHFLTDVLAHNIESGINVWEPSWLPIWVQHPTRSIDLQQHLLHCLQSTTQVEWPSLTDFLTFASRSRAKVVMMIDHLHSWMDWDSTIAKQLASAIKAYTVFDQLHWVICVNDRAYANIAPLTDDIWSTYCDDEPDRFFHAEESVSWIEWKVSLPRSGGWYRLDEINEQQELGIRLLKHAFDGQYSASHSSETGAEPSGFESGQWSLDKIQEMTREVRRELCNPLIATVLADFAQHQSLSLNWIVDARFVEFIEKLRELVVERSLAEWDIVSSRSNQLLIQQAIDYVARAFALATRPEQPLVQLEDNIASTAKGLSSLANHDLLAKALTSLDRAHLIDIFDGDAPDQISRIEWVTLRLELFWQFHLAQQRGKLLLQNQDTDGLDELLIWFATFDSQRLMSGVAQFLLVMLDRDAAKIADELWRRTLAGNGFPLHSGLFAGSRTLVSRQCEIREELLAKRVQPHTPDELVALVSFAHLAAEDAATVPQRMGILQPYFEALGRVGLGAYCAFALSYLIAQVNKMGVMQKVLKNLDRAELLGASEADELAQLCVEKITQILGVHDSGGIADAIITYARQHQESAFEYERSRWQQMAASHLKGRDRYLFRHWLFDHASKTIAGEKKEDTYHFLWKRKWYGADRASKDKGISKQVATEMEKFANFAICDVSQHNENLHHKLVLLVNELVDSGEFRHRENAYYLIRHSERIPLPGVAVIVDEEFRPALRTIAWDRNFHFLFERPDALAFLAANLGNDLPTRRANSAPTGRGSKGLSHKRQRRN